MVVVKFQYDEATRLWDPIVLGASDPIEAKQAFTAVVLTCCELEHKLLSKARVELCEGESQVWRIIPAV